MDVKQLNYMGLRTNCYFKVNHSDGNRDDSNADEGTLCLKDLSVDLGGRRVISNLNKSFHKGRICCVTGKNGAGKSTLLRTACGLIKNSNGAIWLDAKKITSKELKKKAFMVMQDVNYQFFSDSVYNECTLGTKKSSGAF